MWHTKVTIKTTTREDQLTVHAKHHFDPKYCFLHTEQKDIAVYAAALAKQHGTEPHLGHVPKKTYAMNDKDESTFLDIVN